MTLIKTGDGIIDISGKIGGEIYKRDSTGLHIIANTKKTKKTPTDKQKKQRVWYAGLKNAERHGGETAPAIPEEPHDYEALIYRIKKYRMYGVRSLSPPVVHEITEDADLEYEIRFWVTGHWDLFKMIPGMTVDMAVTVALKIYWSIVTTQATNHDHAIQNTFDRMIEISEWFVEGWSAAYFVFWAAAIVILGYVTYKDWIKKALLEKTFSWDCMLIHTKGRWAFGTIYARPSPEMLDIQACQILPGPPLQVAGYHNTVPTHLFRMTWSCVYSETIERLLWNDTYAWDNIETEFIGNAYLTQEGSYRCKVSPWWRALNYINVGWSIPRENACYWLPTFYDVF